MEQHILLDGFNGDDVIAFQDGNSIKKLETLRNALKNSLSRGHFRNGLTTDLANSVQISSNNLIDNGETCEVLKLGDSQWRKGMVKVKVIVEFIPDQEVKPQSELDVFREDEAWPPSDPAT
jgi:KGK domain